MGTDEAKSKLVPALDRSVRILDAISKSKNYLNLSDLARELGIAKSSVHTLCHTLLQSELLIRRPDQTFQLGPHVMRWANAFTQQSDVATEFASIWDQQTELPGATITLSVLEGAEVVYIAARNSDVSHSLIDFHAGMRLPAAFTAFDARRLPRTARIVEQSHRMGQLAQLETPWLTALRDAAVRRVPA